MMKDKQKAYYYLFYFSLLFYILWSQCNVHFMTGELGRLLAEGKLFLANYEIITTNHFSYPNYNYPVANFHWLSAVLIAIVHNIAGFVGIHLLLLGLLLIVITKYYNYWIKEHNQLWVWVVSFLCTPLIISFSEMSIMAFAVVFALFFILITSRYIQNEIATKWVYSLILLQVLWVNIHPTYYLGWMILAATLVEILLNEDESEEKSERKKAITITLVMSLLLSVLNPQFWEVWTTPFSQWGTYHESLMDNAKSVWGSFSDEETQSYAIPLYIVSLSLVGIGSIVMAFKNKIKKMPMVYYTILLGTILLMAWTMVSNAPFLGIVVMALLIQVGNHYIKQSNGIAFWTNYKSPFILVVYLLFPFAFWTSMVAYSKPIQPQTGLGIAPYALDAVTFIKEVGIKGPFFNNREAAGAMLYHLYPEQHPFIDDRYNAESNEFLKQSYFPYLKDEDLTTWHQLKNKYDFNAIYFKLSDETPKNLLFLGNRLIDGEWVMVYENKKNDVILLRNNKTNKVLIEQYQITTTLLK